MAARDSCVDDNHLSDKKKYHSDMWSCSRRRTGALEQCLVAAVVVVCALSLQHGADASPIYPFILKAPDSGTVIAEDNACYHVADVETLCQKCAKLTKSNVVYPMCCEDREEAREWCDRYINFGAHPTE